MEGAWNYNKLIIIFLFSVFFLLHFHPVHAQDSYFSAQDCSSSENYSSNSQFETNLKLLLSSLLSNGPRNGYFQDSAGSNPDTVYGLAQCRGDISTQDCRTCLTNATVDILQRCPNQKSASLRFEFCILRYSNTQFSGQADEVSRSLVNPGKVLDADHFDQQLRSLMNNLSTTAASRRPSYDSGSIDFIQFNDIYGLVQCTVDLSPTSCFFCLRNLISSIPDCCNRSQGARIYSTTCNIRYELYPFVQIKSQSPSSSQKVDASLMQSTTN